VTSVTHGCEIGNIGIGSNFGDYVVYQDDFATAIRLVRCNIFLKGRSSIKLRAKTIIDVLMAGIFCACVAPMISTLWVILFAVVPAHAVHDFKGFLIAALAIFFIALVPACLFGFVCGVISRLYLLVRSAHIATTVRLISECGIIGVLFSLCFSLFLRLLGWGPEEWTNLKGILFIVSVGCPVSILYAILYRRDLLRRSSSSPASTN
jgi:hypothetical protein